MTRHFYIGTGSTAVLAAFSPATGPRSERPPVLICPPWGWTEIASYRVRRQWAELLAADGFPTLRFDLPATGNSAGEVTDSGVVAGWTAATLAAANWLAEAEGEGKAIAAIGLALGGLSVLRAVDDGAPIGAMVLWGVPGRGKRLVREAQAFSRMQPWSAEAGEAGGFDPGVPEGWLEAGGFALSPETLSELKVISSAIAPGSPLKRALLLDRDGIPGDDELGDALETAGVAVEHARGVGWENLVSHPEQATLPAQTVAEIGSWLGAEPTPPVAPPASPPISGALELEVEGRVVRETTLTPDEPWGRPFAVLAEPAERARGGPTAVFLNAGAVRSLGPNRLWAETARRWAARGVPTLRVDLQGIGEADGDPPGGFQVGSFYASHYGDQVKKLLDRIERDGYGSKFILAGLCAGGYWAFRTAVDDPRVMGCLLLNAGALRWVPDLPRQREARRSGRALESRWWRKLFRGDIKPGRIMRLVRAMVADTIHTLGRLATRASLRGEVPLRVEIEGDLDVLRDRGTPLLLAFSADEPLGEELDRGRLRDAAGRWPNLEFVDLPGNDHTLRSLRAQKAAAALLDRELDRLTASEP